MISILSSSAQMIWKNPEGIRGILSDIGREGEIRCLVSAGEMNQEVWRRRRRERVSTGP
jgi:hypothetical protein